MEYLIIYRMKGESSRYQQKLLYDISERFDVQGAVRRKSPAHLTLKYNIFTEDISGIEKAIEEFSDNNVPTPLTLNGFNYFKNPNVIFIDSYPSRRMRIVHKDLLDMLRKIPEIGWDRFDGENLHFHTSLAHSDLTDDKFSQIWQYLQTKPSPYFKLEWDNVTLLKSEIMGGVWKVYNEFVIEP